MNNMSLLDKTRQINSLLQKTAGKPVNFNDMAATLSEVLTGNVFILSRRGNLIGVATYQEIENERKKHMLDERRFPEEYTTGLLSITETTDNIDTESSYSVFPYENRELFQDRLTTIVPMIG